MANNQSNAKRTKILLVCGVMLLSAISASWTLSERPLNSHECFVSITAREMLESGDWVMPTCNGEPRLDKTPLSYWLVAGLAKITGSIDEFTARMPSVIFGVLSVAAILYFVNQWLSFRIAVLSAGVWATSLGYIRYAHNARPEMAMTFFIMLCFSSFYSAINAKNRKRQIAYMLVFWTSFGLANLAKGPAPLPLVIIPLFFYVAIFRQWKIVPKLLPVIGVIIFLAIVLPWPLMIAHKVNWDLVVWKHHFFDRLFGKYEAGDYPFYYYLLIMFKYIVPWVAFLPMALAAPFYRVWNKKQPVMKFLWLWFVVDLVFLTISGGKRQHYILPLMPAMAILIGILIEDMAFVRKAYTHKLAANVLRNHLIVIMTAAVAGPIAIIIAGYVKGPLHGIKTNQEITTASIILSIATIVIAAIVAILFARKKTAYACSAAFAGIVVWVMIGYVSFTNPLDYNDYSRDFGRKVGKTVPRLEELVAYEYISSKSVHYIGRVVPNIDEPSEVYKRHKQGSWIMATSKSLEKLQKDSRFRMVYFREKAEWRKGINISGALFHKSAPVMKED